MLYCLSRLLLTSHSTNVFIRAVRCGFQTLGNTTLFLVKREIKNIEDEKDETVKRKSLCGVAVKNLKKNVQLSKNELFKAAEK